MVYEVFCLSMHFLFCTVQHFQQEKEGFQEILLCSILCHSSEQDLERD